MNGMELLWASQSRIIDSYTVYKKGPMKTQNENASNAIKSKLMIERYVDKRKLFSQVMHIKIKLWIFSRYKPLARF